MLKNSKARRLSAEGKPAIFKEARQINTTVAQGLRRHPKDQEMERIKAGLSDCLQNIIAVIPRCGARSKSKLEKAQQGRRRINEEGCRFL